VAKKLRVLVIDDSAYNRRAIMEMLESVDDIAVIGTAPVKPVQHAPSLVPVLKASPKSITPKPWITTARPFLANSMESAPVRKRGLHQISERVAFPLSTSV